ncbi:hypothetical protein Lal_00024184 [Lupinus albus]|nr:hypothetical protein Lal_00024184 [Lupinus albus]
MGNNSTCLMWYGELLDLPDVVWGIIRPARCGMGITRPARCGMGITRPARCCMGNYSTYSMWYGVLHDLSDVLWGITQPARCGMGIYSTCPMWYGELLDLPDVVWGITRPARCGMGNYSTCPMWYGELLDLPDMVWGINRPARYGMGNYSTCPMWYGELLDLPDVVMVVVHRMLAEESTYLSSCFMLSMFPRGWFTFGHASFALLFFFGHIWHGARTLFRDVFVGFGSRRGASLVALHPSHTPVTMELPGGWRLPDRNLVQQVVSESMVRLGHGGLKGERTGKCVYHSWDPRLSERFSLGRERFTWEGEILGYTGEFSPERELSRLGEKWHFGAVDTLRFSLERESLA